MGLKVRGQSSEMKSVGVNDQSKAIETGMILSIMDLKNTLLCIFLFLYSLGPKEKQNKERLTYGKQ